MLTEAQLKKLALEATGKDNPAEAFEEALRSYVEQKLSHYQKEIERLRHKYGRSWAAFTERLGKEFPLDWEHEQDFMAWEEAATNLEYFEKIAAQLKIHA
jgi:DNA-binding transcriptional MocR family regulator